MPAGSEAPTLPHTWRPTGVRVVGLVAGGALFALVVAVWVAIGPELRARFTPFQRLTALALGLLAAVVWYALLRARLTATSEGVAVVNGYRRRDLAWAQIVAVRLRRGAPWAELDLSDGTTLAVMAIQGSDGARAKDAVRELRAMLGEHTRTERND